MIPVADYRLTAEVAVDGEDETKRDEWTFEENVGDGVYSGVYSRSGSG